MTGWASRRLVNTHMALAYKDFSHVLVSGNSWVALSTEALFLRASSVGKEMRIPIFFDCLSRDPDLKRKSS